MKERRRMHRRLIDHVMVFGWLYAAVPTAFLVGVLVPKAEAFDIRLSTIETQYAVINGKLDTLIYLTRKK